MRELRPCWRPVAVAVAMIVPVAGSVGGVAAGPAAVDTTVPVAAEPRLPEGVYRTPELTRDQLSATALDAGFARKTSTRSSKPTTTRAR